MTRFASEMSASTSESPDDAVPAPESPSLRPSMALTLPPFPSSLESPPTARITHTHSDVDSKTGSESCTWDLMAATISDDQLLKKALQVYSSRNGVEKMRELIVLTTGLVFRPETAESLNSVLPLDMGSKSGGSSQAVNLKSSEESGEKSLQPEQSFAISPSPFAEMLRGAINAGLSGMDSSGSSHLMRSELSVSCSFTLSQHGS